MGTFLIVSTRFSSPATLIKKTYMEVKQLETKVWSVYEFTRIIARIGALNLRVKNVL